MIENISIYLFLIPKKDIIIEETLSNESCYERNMFKLNGLEEA